MAARRSTENFASTPNDPGMKGMVACMGCLLVKTYTQFYEEPVPLAARRPPTHARVRCVPPLLFFTAQHLPFPWRARPC